MQFKHALLALWVGVALLTWYRSALPSPTLDLIYTIAFGAVFILSLIFLARRRRTPKD